MRSVRRIFAFSFCILHSSFCLYAQDWTLSTADFRTEPVTLRAVDEKGVHVASPGEPNEVRVVPPAEFLQLDRGLAGALLDTPGKGSAAKFMVHLVSGDRVGGEPVKVENDRLSWNNAAVGELTIPLSQVATLARAGQPVDPAALAAKREADEVRLSNGDRVRGIVVGMTADSVRIKPADAPAADEPLAVPLASVVWVQFATTGQPAEKPAAAAGDDKSRTYRVRLDDGSSILGTTLRVADNKLTLAIGTGNGEPRPLDLARVVGIEQVNGPVSWLTSRRPSEDVQAPFLSSASKPEESAWRTRLDADVTGQPFVVGGRSFKRGIGVHSYSRLVYPLDGTFKAFRTRYGINDGLSRADVTVRIRAGDKVLHEAKNVRSGVPSPVVVVDLPADAKQLVLEVDYGAYVDVEDRLNWLEPALLREKPKTPATAPAATKPAAQ